MKNPFEGKCIRLWSTPSSAALTPFKASLLSSISNLPFSTQHSSILRLLQSPI